MARARQAQYGFLMRIVISKSSARRATARRAHLAFVRQFTKYVTVPVRPRGTLSARQGSVPAGRDALQQQRKSALQTIYPLF
jgi:hypothetical protein